MRLSRTTLLTAVVAAVITAAVSTTAGIAEPTGNNLERPLRANQSEGFGEGQNQVFSYAQNFHCTIEPFDDLDGIGRGGDGVPAAADPDEMILPECLAGNTAGGATPVIDPAGNNPEESRRFWALVPTFDANGNGVPEGIDPEPGVDLQCPEPGLPENESTTPLGSCTMHPSLVTVDPILDKGARALVGLNAPAVPQLSGVPGPLPVTPPVALPTVGPGVTIPLPNHSHIIETTEDEQRWWQVIVVLVEDPAIWPDKDGNCAAGRENCLTSIDALRSAQTRGESAAGQDIPTNIWLFFANQPEQGPVGENAPAEAGTGHDMSHMGGMHHG